MNGPLAPGEFAAYLDAEMAALRHDMEMYFAMDWNEALIGVPYGPALCQAHPPEFKGLAGLMGDDVPAWLRLDDLDEPDE